MHRRHVIAVLSAFCAIALIVSIALAQTEEQLNHPKYLELMQYYTTYNDANGKGDYAAAATAAKKALELGLEIFGPDDPYTAIFYNNYGSALESTGAYDQAIEHYKKALAIFIKVLGADHPKVAANYNNLGAAYGHKGEYDQAIEYYKKALAIDLKQLGPEHPDVAIRYSNLGSAYESKGEYDQAIEYCKKALAIGLRKLGAEHPDVAIRYNNLGSAYESKGEYDRAIEYYREALAIFIKVLGADHPNVAVNYSNLGSAYRYKGEYDQAIEYCKKALAIVLKKLGPEHPDVAMRYNNLGSAYESKGEYDRAIEYYKKALAIGLRKLGAEHPDVAVWYNNLGSAYESKGEYDRAIEYYREALAIVLKSGAYQQAVDTAVNLGLLYIDRSIYAEAQKTFNDALKIIDTARARFSSGKAEFTSRNINCYYYSLKASALMNDNTGAFDAAERMRARGFLERLSLSAALVVEGIQNEDASRMLALNDEIESLTAKRNAEINKPQANQDDKKLLIISDELQKKLNEFEALDGKLMKNEKYRALRKPKTATLDQAQKLANERAILEYVIWEVHDSKSREFKHKQSYCIVITGKSVVVVNLDRDFDYTGTVMKYREALLRRGESRGVNVDAPKRDDADALGALLFEKLVAPVEKHIGGVKELIIVPDGALAFLPFDSLRLRSGLDGRQGKYLCEKYAITMEPSVSVLLMIKGRSFSSQREEFLAFGGGLYSTTGGSQKRGARAGVKIKGMSDKTRDYYSSRSTTDKKLDYYESLDLKWDDLPGTVDEVAAIHSGVYAGRGSKVLTGKDVSEKTVKEYSKKGELARYKSLHMACHGYYDKDSPSFSSVVFSEVSGRLAGQSREDGYLSIEEAALLNLKADIVNLSACETGLGRIVSGDGVVGLTRAFNVAGANRVGVTLWQVDDEATKDFMVAVYKKVVREKKPFGAAYVETKREFIKSRKYGDPYFWSPFVLYGE